MSRLMLDPSLALAGRALRWLEEDVDAREGVVISQAFVERFFNEELTRRYQLYPASPHAQRRRERFAALRGRISTFSYREAQLPPAADAVLSALLDDARPDAEIFADEWAFLNSESWMAASMRGCLDAFRDAGATVVEHGRRVRDEMIQVVVPGANVPSVLTPDFLARVTVKWLILGGVAAGTTPLIGPTGGAFAGLIAGPVVRAFDP